MLYTLNLQCYVSILSQFLKSPKNNDTPEAMSPSNFWILVSKY